MNEDAVERIIASSLAGTIKVVESVQPPRGRIELKNAARYIGATLVGCAVQPARGVHYQVSRWLAFVRKIELFASLPLSVFQGEREQRSAAELSADCGHTEEMSLAVQRHAGARFTAVGGVKVAERVSCHCPPEVGDSSKTLPQPSELKLLQALTELLPPELVVP